MKYVQTKSYDKAKEIAETIDWKRVKNASMLCTVSEIYEYTGEYQKSREILFIAYDRSPGSRKIVYRLGTLALRLGETEEALDCYEEFVSMAPKDPNQYILKYKILKAQNAPLKEQIRVLEEFKKAEYIEKWAYELAELYDKAGMTTECLEECDDLILWFSDGVFVQKAMELKIKYKPLHHSSSRNTGLRKPRRSPRRGSRLQWKRHRRKSWRRKVRSWKGRHHKDRQPKRSQIRARKYSQSRKNWLMSAR